MTKLVTKPDRCHPEGNEKLRMGDESFLHLFGPVSIFLCHKTTGRAGWGADVHFMGQENNMKSAVIRMLELETSYMVARQVLHIRLHWGKSLCSTRLQILEQASSSLLMQASTREGNPRWLPYSATILPVLRPKERRIAQHSLLHQVSGW